MNTCSSSSASKTASDYHKSTDDFANIQPEFYVKAVETIIEAIRMLDDVQ